MAILRFKDLEHQIKLASRNFKIKVHSVFWQTFLQFNCALTMYSENLHGLKKYWRNSEEKSIKDLVNTKIMAFWLTKG